MPRTKWLRGWLTLALCALLLGGCIVPPEAAVTPSASPDALPLPQSEAVRTQDAVSTLWFRYLDEPRLMAETRVIASSPTVSYEQALLDALIAGSAHADSLFAPGVRVLSVHRQNRRLFVTLSKEIMDAFPDEPAAWQSDPAWQSEVPLRRMLAMQSIVATVTENCDVDSVVILVEQTATPLDSLRLRQGYYRLGTGDDMALADELTRDDAWLLTPGGTLKVILDCWQSRDFARLYRYADTDLDEADFLADMAGLPHLLRAGATGHVSVNAAGDQAVFTADLTLLDGSAERSCESVTLRLIRRDGLWRIPLEQLTRWKEALP